MMVDRYLIKRISKEFAETLENLRQCRVLAEPRFNYQPVILVILSSVWQWLWLVQFEHAFAADSIEVLFQSV